MRRAGVSVVLAALVAFAATGCYWNQDIQGNQVGLKMDDGVSITEVVGAGRYTNMGFYATIKAIDVSAKTSLWEDFDLWTSDKQSINFKVSVTYSRKGDTESIKKMWAKYNLEAQDDTALERLVLTRIPRVAKQVTSGMTLDQMLGIDETENHSRGREVLQQKMSELLQVEFEECGVDLLDIGVNDIGVDELYASKLKEKAASKVELELAKQKSLQLAEQVNQEKAQTEVELEIARRNNLVKTEENQIYVNSPQAFELEKLKLLQGIIGSKDKIYFIPEGSDLSLYLSGNGFPLDQ